MKTAIRSAGLLALTLIPNLVCAQDESTRLASWHASSLGGALLNMAIFALAGIVLAVIGYKLFDKCTPGDLHKEIIENKNTAAAIVAAAVIIGVCVIVAVAMMS